MRKVPEVNSLISTTNNIVKYSRHLLLLLKYVPSFCEL